MHACQKQEFSYHLCMQWAREDVAASAAHLCEMLDLLVCTDWAVRLTLWGPLTSTALLLGLQADVVHSTCHITQRASHGHSVLLQLACLGSVMAVRGGSQALPCSRQSWRSQAGSHSSCRRHPSVLAPPEPSQAQPTMYSLSAGFRQSEGVASKHAAQTQLQVQNKC